MSQALYRRYRPERFADVIGQEHVTGPLVEAIRNDRVSHAYLFSGPRGCGKTTSARILARCLNCEQGPTSEPCGVCQSCQDLARDTGGTSMDVIEIDAATHNGVDDARELRERAFYAPASSRFKIYIIDEAHMVTPAAFNALLKLVEEPPDFVKFVFATTEPEKVLGTIKSRTHHYPFRLVGARVLESHLEKVCQAEDVTVQPGVLPLVVRAGAGSVRDALSVLDQLIGGSTGDAVTYDLAVSLLGFTPATLLDDAVEALSTSDGARLFSVVDSVIDAGLDPRRFLEDLLQRLRDLVIVAAAPDALESGLVTVPDDQRERMVVQAQRMGLPALTRAADLAAAGLVDLRGATAPRLQLEIVCAKLLLPLAHDNELGVAVRLDRLERRLAIGGVPPTEMATPRPPTRAKPPQPAAAPSADVPASSGQPAAQPAQAPPQPVEDAADQAPSGDSAAMDLHEVRRLWPNVVDQVKQYRRTVWSMLFEKSDVLSVDATTLTVGLRDVGSVRAFASGGKDEIVRQAVIDVLGLDRTVAAVHDPSLAPSSSTGATPSAVDVRGRSADEPDPSDADAHVEGGTDLIAAQLGGRVIGEIDHT